MFHFLVLQGIGEEICVAEKFKANCSREEFVAIEGAFLGRFSNSRCYNKADDHNTNCFSDLKPALKERFGDNDSISFSMADVFIYRALPRCHPSSLSFSLNISHRCVKGKIGFATNESVFVIFVCGFLETTIAIICEYINSDASATSSGEYFTSSLYHIKTYIVNVILIVKINPINAGEFYLGLGLNTNIRVGLSTNIRVGLGTNIRVGLSTNIRVLQLLSKAMVVLKRFLTNFINLSFIELKRRLLA